MSSPPYILILSPIESVVSSGYHSRFFHKLSLQLKTMGVDVTVLSPEAIDGKGGKFNTQQLSWLRYCVDKAGGCDIQDVEPEYHRNSNRFVPKFRDVIKGGAQIFRQCWSQKPTVLQVYQPFSYGLMALPASLILGIPMVLTFRSEEENIIPQSWIGKLILRGLIRCSKAVIVSSKQFKKRLKSQTLDREIVIISEEFPTHFTPTISRFYSSHWQHFFPLNQIYSDYWQDVINRWCQVLAKTCCDRSFQSFRNEKIIKNGPHKSKGENHPSQATSEDLYSVENRKMSPLLNIAYYKRREFEKLFS